MHSSSTAPSSVTTPLQGLILVLLTVILVVTISFFLFWIPSSPDSTSASDYPWFQTRPAIPQQVYPLPSLG